MIETDREMVTVPPTAEGKTRAIHTVDAFGARRGWPKRIRDEIALILEEWLQNIVSHSQAPPTSQVKLSVWERGDDAMLEIRDGGVHFNPLESKMPDLTLPTQDRPAGGNGILIMKRLATEFRWERQGNENVVVVRKFRAVH